MSNETALVLAAPERKRILRELLPHPEPWPIADRNLYRHIIQCEYMDLTETQVADAIAEDTAKRVFSRMVLSGAPEERARQMAEQKASEPPPWEKSKGRRERERRRRYREAVTACSGVLAVTTGLVQACIICGRALPVQARRDSAYCSGRCRQTAYRRRQKQAPAIEPAVADNTELTLADAARITGVSIRKLKKWRRLADMPEAAFESRKAHNGSAGAG